jgi:hypothetical protein
MAIQKRRVRESLLGMVNNIKIGRVDRWGQGKDGNASSPVGVLTMAIDSKGDT